MTTKKVPASEIKVPTEDDLRTQIRIALEDWYRIPKTAPCVLIPVLPVTPEALKLHNDYAEQTRTAQWRVLSSYELLPNYPTALPGLQRTLREVMYSTITVTDVVLCLHDVDSFSAGFFAGMGTQCDKTVLYIADDIPVSSRLLPLTFISSPAEYQQFLDLYDRNASVQSIQSRLRITKSAFRRF